MNRFKGKKWQLVTFTIENYDLDEPLLGQDMFEGMYSGVDDTMTLDRCVSSHERHSAATVHYQLDKETITFTCYVEYHHKKIKQMWETAKDLIDDDMHKLYHEYRFVTDYFNDRIRSCLSLIDTDAASMKAAEEGNSITAIRLYVDAKVRISLEMECLA